MTDRPLSVFLRPRVLGRWVAVLGLLLLVVIGTSRLAIEWLWFAEFNAQPLVLRRWLLQLVAFALVMGLGVPLQLQQLQRCWRLRQQHRQKQVETRALLQLGQRSLLSVLCLLLLLLA